MRQNPYGDSLSCDADACNDAGGNSLLPRSGDLSESDLHEQSGHVVAGLQCVSQRGLT